MEEDGGGWRRMEADGGGWRRREEDGGGRRRRSASARGARGAARARVRSPLEGEDVVGEDDDLVAALLVVPHQVLARAELVGVHRVQQPRHVRVGRAAQVLAVELVGHRAAVGIRAVAGGASGERVSGWRVRRLLEAEQQEANLL